MQVGHFAAVLSLNRGHGSEVELGPARRIAVHHEHGTVGYANDALGSGAAETVAEAPTMGSEYDENGIPLDRNVRDCLMRSTRAHPYLGASARSRELARARIEPEASSRAAVSARARGPRRIDDMQQKQLRTQSPGNGIGTRHCTLGAWQQIGRTQHSRTTITL